jgi:hypothetical protein
MKSFVLLTLFAFSNLYLVAQTTGIIKGRVSAASNNSPIDFATVALEGTTTGTQTDDKGEFEIQRSKAGLL